MPSFSIRNPYFIIVCALIVTVVGITVLVRMPVDMFPPINLTVVVVATFYPGMPPEQVENDITQRQERFFTLAPGIEHIESRALPGVSIIKIFFQPGTNADTAVSAMANLAAAEQRRLPPGTLPPIVLQFDASSVPVCLVALKGEGMTEAALRDIGHYKVRTQLAKVQGAAVPPPFGGLYRQIMVYVDPQKLEAHQLSPMDVVRAVNEANLIMPAGGVRIGPIDYPIYTNSQYRDVESILQLPIKTVGQASVMVGDIGTVQDAAQIQYNIVRVDGQPSVYQPVLRQGGDTNTIAVVNAVKGEVGNLLDVPDNLVARVVFDQSLFIKKSIKALLQEGGIGLFLTCVMILLFLGSMRATLAVFLSIPLSALATFIALFFGGSSLNSMTLGGLALAFSRLIDNSVVVLENIFRRMELGESSRVAAESGAREVALPVLASTLTTAVVFFPVIFLYGVSKDLFSALALTVVLALFASYLIALTIVPLFCAVFIRGHHSQEAGLERRTQLFSGFNRGFLKMLSGYDRLLGVLLHRPIATVVVLLVFFVASLALFPRLGVSFFPRTDAGQFVINLKAPLGTNLQLTEREVSKVEKLVREVVAPEDFEMMVSNIGVVPDYSAIYTSNSAPHTAFLQVSLKDGHKVGSYEYVERVRKRLRAEMPHMSVYFQSGGFVDAVLNFGMPAPIDVQVSGPDLETPYQVAAQIAAEVRRLPGVQDILIPQDLDNPAIRLEIDRTRASQLGLSQKEIVSNLITAVTSNQMIAPTFWTDPKSNNDYYLTVQYPETQVKDISDLKNIPLRSPLQSKSTRMDMVGTIKRVQGPTEVDHYGLRKVIDVYVNISTEDIGRVAEGIERIISKTKLPQGVRVDLRGIVNGMRASFRSFGLGLVLAVVLLYLILIAQFRSFIDPLLILLAVPMGLIGVLVTLYGTGTTLNVQSLMGIVMMVGIVVSNSILLVDFTRRLRADGMPLRDAVAMAGRIRLRPILMTSLATIIGLLPMAFKLGTGSEAYTPLARAIIGGMTVSLIFTVFIVPAAYLAVYRNRDTQGDQPREVP
ncbi:MAG: efflux RND transporter permease subunit [Acidobacteria bacterium]|nr:efflux RND transporter permease subunit [Acidobacteriota bacterium]